MPQVIVDSLNGALSGRYHLERPVLSRSVPVGNEHRGAVDAPGATGGSGRPLSGAEEETVYCPDLSPWRHPSPWRDPDNKRIAVGWLEPGHPIPRGDVPNDFVVALVQLLGLTWEPARYCGGQYCGFCPDQQGYSSRNLYVPAEDRVYFSPEGILHYTRTHRYQPPVEFIDAVLECPPVTSLEYFTRLERAGLLQQSAEEELESFITELRWGAELKEWMARGSPGEFSLD